MFGSRFDPAKCEIKCRLCVQRIKLLRNKKLQQLKVMRKDIAELLRSGKQEYARIRVEAVIRENQAIQAYELLELFLEFLAVRGPLIGKSKEIPRDLVESVSSLIYAAQRVPDLPELVQIRQLLAAKFGKEYAAQASSDLDCDKWQVHDKLRECLTIEAPAGDVKLQVLTEIAQEYSVDWDAQAAARDLLPQVAPQYVPPPQYAPPPQHIPQHQPPPQQHYAPPPPQPQPQHQPQPSLQAQRPVNPPVNLDPRLTASQAFEAARNAQQAAHQAIQSSRQQQQQPGAGPPPAPQPKVVTRPTVTDTTIVNIPPPRGWLEDGSQPPEDPSPAPSTAPAPAPPAPFPGPAPPPSSMDYDDIQRAYDSAPGPPSKAPSGPPPPASAPYATDLVPSLPDPPTSGGAASKGDELDELQKRFLALKNL